MPFGIGKQVNVYSSYITKEEYAELMYYAKQRRVKLEGFKKFTGNIAVIKEIVDDVVVGRGHFVEGTTYRSIIRHELGHIVANMYGINPMAIARMVLSNRSDVEIIKYVKDNLSLYAADYPDGREFISECFSAYYSGVENSFAKEYVLQCIKLVKEERNNDKK